MTDGIVRISDAERLARMEKARQLMVENGIDAIAIEGGSSLVYFTDVNWWNSERTFLWVLPARGEMAWVCPKFEEDRAREQIRFGTRHPDLGRGREPLPGHCRGPRQGPRHPHREDRHRGAGPLLPLTTASARRPRAIDCVSADPVTIGCRVIKSPAEMALMQRANDITVAAYKAALAMLKEGMTKGEFAANAAGRVRRSGRFGRDRGRLRRTDGVSARQHQAPDAPEGRHRPHGRRLRGRGLQSDISRTIVFGEPTKKQREVWDLEKKAQLAAFQAAKPGVPCEAVDRPPARSSTDAGLGPDYKVPGLPHRTGHGIGLDGHEWIYLVRGNKTPMRPGMCFTNEPMIVIPGEFGVRLEDDMHITDDGAKFFSQPSPSIEQPFI